MKYQGCLLCLVALYDWNGQSSLCPICDGEDMLIPITHDVLAELKAAYADDASKLRYFTNLELNLGGGCGKDVYEDVGCVECSD